MAYESRRVPLNNASFSVLQKMNSLNLAKPVGIDHMYFAAMNSKSCKLTVLGENHWRLLLSKQRI